MGMMVTARKIAETETEIRYAFGLDREFDRILIIDKKEWLVTTEDGNLDSAAGKIAGKIKNAWQEHSSFPEGAVFAS